LRIRRYRALICRTLLAALILFLTPVSALAEGGTEKMELKRGFLRSLKFRVGDGEPKPVYGFWGLSFKRDFVDVMSAHPAALDQAQKALRWKHVGFMGELTILGGYVWLMTGAFGDDGSDHDTDWAPVAVMGAGALAMLAGSLGAGSSLNRAVEMYNEAGGAQGADLTPGLSRRFLAERGPEGAAFYRDTLR
jgi:hypothetical protein